MKHLKCANTFYNLLPINKTLCYEYIKKNTRTWKIIRSQCFNTTTSNFQIRTIVFPQWGKACQGDTPHCGEGGSNGFYLPRRWTLESKHKEKSLISVTDINNIITMRDDWVYHQFWEGHDIPYDLCNTDCYLIQMNCYYASMI